MIKNTLKLLIVNVLIYMRYEKALVSGQVCIKKMLDSNRCINISNPDKNLYGFLAI
jgi:hypothetical protein